MLVAATTYTSLVVWFSITIVVVEIGVGTDIPLVGLWLILLSAVC